MKTEQEQVVQQESKTGDAVLILLMLVNVCMFGVLLYSFLGAAADVRQLTNVCDQVGSNFLEESARRMHVELASLSTDPVVRDSAAVVLEKVAMRTKDSVLSSLVDAFFSSIFPSDVFTSLNQVLAFNFQPAAQSLAGFTKAFGVQLYSAGEQYEGASNVLQIVSGVSNLVATKVVPLSNSTAPIVDDSVLGQLITSLPLVLQNSLSDVKSFQTSGSDCFRLLSELMSVNWSGKVVLGNDVSSWNFNANIQPVLSTLRDICWSLATANPSSLVVTKH